MRGFSLVEMLVAAAMVVALAGTMIELARGARAASSAVGDMADVQQKLRVAADAIQHDLLLAGAGGIAAGAGSLAGYLPPIRPSAGLRDDTDVTFGIDRITVLWIPLTEAEADVTAPTESTTALPIGNGISCAIVATCGFESGMQAIVFDRGGPGLGYDVFTVGDASPGWISRSSGEGSFSRQYSPTAHIGEVVHHTYYLDRSDPANSRLMRGDGRTAFPLVDGVRNLRFTYYSDLAELAAADLTDGPFWGVAPNRFDADLLRIRRVRVHLEVASLPAPHHPSSSLELSLDVTPRNLNLSR